MDVWDCFPAEAKIRFAFGTLVLVVVANAAIRLSFPFANIGDRALVNIAYISSHCLLNEVKQSHNACTSALCIRLYPHGHQMKHTYQSTTSGRLESQELVHDNIIRDTGPC